MHAIKARSDRSDRDAMMSRTSAAHGAFVLPRFLRKPFRIATRLFGGGVKIPRHAGTLGMIGFLSATGLYGMAVGNHTHTVIKATASTFGFAIEKVTVAGNVETSEIDILEKLGLDGETSLIGFNADEARQAIETLPWVSSVEIRKVYPGSVVVSLQERKAFAVWQSGADLVLVDDAGKPIVPLSGSRYTSLPLVVGEGASSRGKAFIETVAAFPDLAAKVRAYARVSDRRWDLLFDNGVRVLLPEQDVKRALAEVETLQRTKDIFGRDILSLDMRLDDRVTVQLTPAGMESREKMLKAREKAAKAAGRRV
ncbi:cell division protein FtsQ/DivIB [Pseudochrobactrum sp. MP213Fo]|uniref:cell division protein FtsQ/DivIB n=1 Tax=Pseudochrobactrum sp. MP213Fo TaxID=3022250 RepID=UPI003BA139F9